MTREEYQKYLKSPRWKRIKKRMFLLYKVCQKCGKGYSLEVHHQFGYKNIFHERISELRLYCHDCHMEIPHPHRQKGIRYMHPSEILHIVWVILKRAYAVPYKRN